MSDTIHATVHSDPELSAIRTMVAGKNDGIPFTLFPVRIETRFMKVDKPIYVRDPFPGVLTDIATIIRVYINIPSWPPTPEFIPGIKEANVLAAGLNEKIKSVTRLSISDKTLLNENLKTLETHLKQYTPFAGKQTEGKQKALKSAEDNSEFGELHTQLLSYTQAAQKSAGLLLPTQNSTNESATAFLSSLNSIRNTIENLAGKKLTQLDYKAKRKAFAAIETRLALLEKDMLDVRKQMDGNMQATPEQLKELEELLLRLNPGLAILKKNIETLESNYKKAEYTGKLRTTGLALGKLKTEIETLIQPRLVLKNELRTTDARKLLGQSNELLLMLSKVNAEPLTDVKTIKTFRDGLFKKLETLRTQAHRVIESNAEDLEALQNTWQEADKALSVFAAHLQALSLKNKKDEVVLLATAKKIEEEYQVDLSGLKPGVKSGIPALTNKVLEKNVSVYERTMREIKRIVTRIEQRKGSRDEAERFEKRMLEVQALNKKFEADSRELHIVPETKLAELKALTAKLDETVQSTAKRLKIELPKETKDATGGIAATAGQQVSDIIERKDRFAAEGRSGIAVLVRTLTQKELWVRIYPDDIAVHVHEEALTQAEADSGKAYWYEIWAAGNDKDLKLAAWRAISASYGPQRAAWIVKSLEPSSPQISVPAFASVSEYLLDANKLLQQVHTHLDEGIKQRADVFEVLHTVHEPLKKTDALLKKINADSETLLRKTQAVLQKTRSRLGAYIDAVERISPNDKKHLGKHLEVAREVNETFGNIIGNFKKIRPAKASEINMRLTEQRVFPDVTIKNEEWTQAPHSRVMPDRFVVAALRNGTFRYLETGNQLPADKLVVGLDPSTFNTSSFAYDADKNLIVADSIKWLTDFNEARSIGMAVSFEINDEDWENGFDQLFVLGVKNTTPAHGKKLIEDLIDNHHYLPLGASLLPVGTATNNTKSGESGFRSFETDASLSFETERNAENGDTFTPDADYPSDSERLAAAWGVKQSVFRHLENSTATGISDALNMNKALFNGTLGSYLEEGMDTVFNLDNINRTKTFFSSYVSARGYLPSLRTGTQPYGILPTTAFSRFAYTANDSVLPTLTKDDFNNTAAIETELQTRYNIRLKSLLALINNQWTTIRNSSVKNSQNMAAAADPQAYFMDMLGLDATSVEQYFRYGLNVAAREGDGDVGEFSINFNPADAFSPTNVALTFRNHMVKGYYHQSDNFPDEGHPSYTLADKYNRIQNQFNEARVFYIRHLQDQAQLLGQEIDSRELSEELPVTPSPTGTPEEQYLAQNEVRSYVDWMLNQNPWDVHASNRFSELVNNTVTGGMPSKSILFMLLRHSLLAAYADAMLKILEHEGLVSQKIRKKLGQAKHYLTPVQGHMRYVTKWNYLFGKIGPLTDVLGNSMNTSNSFFRYMNDNDIYLNRYLSPEPAHAYVFSNYGGHAGHAPYVAELNVTRQAISKLKEIPTAQLDHLVSEHLDLCSYRLDAWYLGLVNKRLHEQRTTHSTGTHIGAYGWVENLRRGADLQAASNLPSGLWKSGDGPVYTDGDNQGYIHAPSLNHAITAAILRAGYKANAATADTQNQMAVNLSSERVRTALNLLSGIRGGQEVGALLGYQFERGLHERYQHLSPAPELDEFIYDFRELFPMNVPVSDSASVQKAQIARTAVVNGMELLEFAQDFVGEPSSPGDSLYESLEDEGDNFWNALRNNNLLNATAAEKDAMIREIDRMADAFDALGDLCISESVYQVAQGNHVRASAILDKLAKGDVPNDIMIADTPRTGTVVTHKVALFVNRVATIDLALTEAAPDPLSGTDIETGVAATNARPTGWNAAFTPRALLEPTLNKWIGEMIGDPSKIKCLSEYTVDSATTHINQQVTMSVADLGLQPLDIIHLFGTGALNGGTELNTRIANYTRAQIGALPSDFEGTADDVPVRIRYTERDSSWSSDDFSFYEKSGYILSMRQLLTSSGILSADHVHIPGEEQLEANQVRNQDINDLSVRVSNAHARLQQVYDALETFFTDEIDPEDAATHTYSVAEINSLRSIMAGAASFGVPASMPELQAGTDNSTGQSLMLSAISIYKAIADRLQRAAVELTKANDTSLTNDPRTEAFIQAARCIMEPSFRVWPQFTLRNAAELSAQLTMDADKGLLRAADAFATDSWTQGMGRVRERMSGLDTVQMMAENFDIPLADTNVVQLPFALDGDGNSADHWLALPYPAGYTPSEDKLSVAIMNSAAITTDPGAPKVALLIDEWVEIIPSATETTGLTFNYDQPDAKAPNTILLAVTPRETGHWSWDDLMITLRDTLELSKNRAVEPEHLENTVFGQIVPGILTEIVPPQLLPPPEETESNPLGYQVVTDFKVNNDTYEPETES